MGWFSKRVGQAKASTSEVVTERFRAATDSAQSVLPGKRTQALQRPVLRIPQTGYPANEVVGESNYLKSIKAAVNGRQGETNLWVTLEREPSNRFDENAVRVAVNGNTVGYVPRSETSDLQLLLKAADAAGLAVEAWGRVYYSGDVGSVSYDAGDVALAWPMTAHPGDEAAAVWPIGRKLKVSLDESAKSVVQGWISRAYCPGRAAAYLQVQLPEDEGRVTASFDGITIGSLSPSASSKMAEVIKIASAGGRSTYVLGEVVGNALVAEVKILVKPTEELSNAEISALTAPISPTLPPPQLP